MRPIRLAIVGGGQICFHRHVPALEANPAFALVGIADPKPRAGDIPTWPSLEALAAAVEVDAVAICTPPPVRFALACQALDLGKHVMLEKPPCASVLQVAELERRVAVRGVSLYTAWHSQHAPAVPAMKAWLEGKRMRRIDMTWCEDARRWHPGQRWLWEAGGLGIFDPAINALSILAAATDDPLHLDRAIFHMPANSDTPIAAELSGATAGGAAFTAWTDFRQAGQQTWTLHIETDDGVLDMTLGGAELALDGRPQTLASNGEYPPLYFRFAELIRSGKSEVEVRPLMLAADAFLIAQRREVEAFHDDARPPSRP